MLKPRRAKCRDQGARRHSREVAELNWSSGRPTPDRLLGVTLRHWEGCTVGLNAALGRFSEHGLGLKQMVQEEELLLSSKEMREKGPWWRKVIG